MPIYEYECESCGRIEEALQKMSDKPLKTCGHCQGKLHRLISQSSFHLKGTGWYVTDYAGKNGKPESKTKETESKSKETAKSTDKSDKSSATDSGKTAAKAKAAD